MARLPPQVGVLVRWRGSAHVYRDVLAGVRAGRPGGEGWFGGTPLGTIGGWFPLLRQRGVCEGGRRV
eukprot:3828883-Alexandrium_andersonii.AAC.1